MPDLSDPSLQLPSIEDGGNKDGGYKPEFSTTQLAGILDCTRVVPNFFCDVIFNQQINFTTDSIFWDKVYDDMDMAPAVCSCVQAPLIGIEQQFDREYFSPAYIKIKHILDACTPLPMMPGETPWGDLTPEERFDLAMNRLLAKQDRMIRKTQEFWSAQAVVNGQYDVEGELYPKANVNFKRDPSLTWKLKEHWGGKGADASDCALDDLQDAFDKVACTSDGSPEITDLMMTSKTCRKMKQDKSILDCLKTERGTALLEAPGFEITPRPIKIGGVRRPFDIGNVRVWCVDSYYMAQQPDGKKVKTPYIPEGHVIGMALGDDDCSLQPTKLFGAIKDCEFMRSAETYTTMWKINDPSAKVVMTQTAPLPVVLNANASFNMKVC